MVLISVDLSSFTHILSSSEVSSSIASNQCLIPFLGFLLLFLVNNGSTGSVGVSDRVDILFSVVIVEDKVLREFEALVCFASVVLVNDCVHDRSMEEIDADFVLLADVLDNI